MCNCLEEADCTVLIIVSGTSSDYEEWMPHQDMKQVDLAHRGCLLGQKVIYKRLKHDAW